MIFSQIPAQPFSITPMNKDNAIPYVSLGVWIVGLTYLWLISGQPRMADGALSGDEMNIVEKALALAMPLALFANLAIGLRRAYIVRSWIWFLICLFWPFSFVYTLLVNRTNSR